MKNEKKKHTHNGCCDAKDAEKLQSGPQKQQSTHTKSKVTPPKYQAFPDEFAKYAVLKNPQLAINFTSETAYRMKIKLIGVESGHIVIETRIMLTGEVCYHRIARAAFLDRDLKSNFTIRFEHFYSQAKEDFNDNFNPDLPKVQNCDARLFTEALELFGVGSGKTAHLCVAMRQECATQYTDLLETIARRSLEAVVKDNFSGLCVSCGIEINKVIEQFDLRIIDVTPKYVLIQFVNQTTGNSHRILADAISTTRNDEFTYHCFEAAKQYQLDVLVKIHDICEDAEVVCSFREENGRQFIQGFYKWQIIE